MTERDFAELDRISRITFTRYFNRMKGLSWAERDHIKTLKFTNSRVLKIFFRTGATCSLTNITAANSIT